MGQEHFSSWLYYKFTNLNEGELSPASYHLHDTGFISEDCTEFQDQIDIMLDKHHLLLDSINKFLQEFVQFITVHQIIII